MRSLAVGVGNTIVEPQVDQYKPILRFELHPNAAMHGNYVETLSNAIMASERIKTAPA